jgi:hypothetical protein
MKENPGDSLKKNKKHQKKKTFSDDQWKLITATFGSILVIIFMFI